MKAMVGFQSELFKQRDITAKQNNIMSGIPTLNTTTDNARASGGYQDREKGQQPVFLVVSIMITKVAIWLRRICVMTVLHVFYAINVGIGSLLSL